MSDNNYYPGMEFETPTKIKPAPLNVVSKVDNFYNYTQEVKGEDEVLIKFEADWCMPCKAMSSVVEDFAAKHPTFKVLAVDIEGEGFDDLLTEYKVRSLPTFVYLRAGHVVSTTCGTNSKTELHKLVTGD